MIEKEWVVQKVIHDSGWGLEPRHIASPDAQGAWKFSPVIRESADLQKLRWPTIAYAAQATEQSLAEAHELFGDILTIKLDDVLTLPHLRRSSVSPFANVDRCASRLEGGYIFSWKPRPSDLVGTCQNHPERFDHWTQIARQKVDRVHGVSTADEPL